MVQRLPVQALALRRWPEQLGLLRRVGVPGADLELIAVGVLEVDRYGFDVQVGARSREWHAQTAQLLRDTVEHLGARAEGDVRPVALAVAVGERLAVVWVADLEQHGADVHEDVRHPAALAKPGRVVDLRAQGRLVEIHGPLYVSHSKSRVVHSGQAESVVGDLVPRPWLRVQVLHQWPIVAHGSPCQACLTMPVSMPEVGRRPHRTGPHSALRTRVRRPGARAPWWRGRVRPAECRPQVWGLNATLPLPGGGGLAVRDRLRPRHSSASHGPAGA